jgi:hypothetical protein
MPHSIVFNSDKQCIEIEFHGDITAVTLGKMCLEFLRVVQETNCYLSISDFRSAILKLSTVDLFRSPQTLLESSTAAGVNGYALKRALVIARDERDYHFFETVMHNQGQKLQVFKDMAQAHAWLLQK